MVDQKGTNREAALPAVASKQLPRSKLLQTLKDLVGKVLASSSGMAVKAVASPRRFSWIHVICERKCSDAFR